MPPACGSHVARGWSPRAPFRGPRPFGTRAPSPPWPSRALCRPVRSCMMRGDAARQPYAHQFRPRSGRSGLRAAHRPTAHRPMATRMRRCPKPGATQEGSPVHGALRRASDRIRDSRFHSADHVRLGGARPAQGLENILSSRRRGGGDSHYDSGRVDPAVPRGMAARSLLGEAQSAESAQGDTRKPREDPRVLSACSLQECRRDARQPSAAAASGCTISGMIAVAQPVQNSPAMSIDALYRRGYVAAAIGVLAVAAATPRRLAAQGGERLNRATDPAAAVSLEPAHLDPARGMLRSLVGTWRFEMWFAGNFDDAPDASGTRVVKTLFDDLRLQWTEQLDHSTIQGQGVLGFDPGNDRFFSSAVYNGGSAPEFMTGTLDAGEPLVTFSPVATAAGTSPGQKLVQSSVLSVLDQNHSRGWRWTGGGAQCSRASSSHSSILKAGLAAVPPLRHDSYRPGFGSACRSGINSRASAARRSASRSICWE